MAQPSQGRSNNSQAHTHTSAAARIIGSHVADSTQPAVSTTSFNPSERNQQRADREVRRNKDRHTNVQGNWKTGKHDIATQMLHQGGLPIGPMADPWRLIA
jgi:hypothetical protein